MLLIAYIGPGGGLAITLSILSILLGVVAVLFSYVAWPVTLLLSAIRRKRTRFEHPFRKVVILGLDGLDPKLLRQYMAAGRLPNFSQLAQQGHFSDLATTLPAITPAAWPSFMTGNDPSFHGIFDFITPDRGSYLPRLSSYETLESSRFFNFGPWRIPLTPPRMRSRRKGLPFWEILAGYGVECTILRVPITFPPQKFQGRLLCGLCVPDLLGSQGTSTCYTSRKPPDGARHAPLLAFKKGVARSRVFGPRHPWRRDGRRLSVPLVVQLTDRQDKLRFGLGSHQFELSVGEQSEWLRLRFRAGITSLLGQVRVRLVRVTPHVVVYVSPVQITPERPVMPVSHPRLFSDYLAKRVGTFGTLGFLEDTTALNNGTIDEQAFLQEAYDVFAERQKMLFHTLDVGADDLIVCVFDTPDRIQHMFWHYIESNHPARSRLSLTPGHEKTIERLYVAMDRLVGDTLARLPDDALLLVASDHGFGNFRRCVDVNAWLHENGYLHLKPHADADTPWLQAVDWSRTKAYAFGLSGIYINRRGRERQGIVEPGEEFDALIVDLRIQLEQLTDHCSLDGQLGALKAIRAAVPAQSHFRGPYRDRAPDLLLAYEPGYRVAWECAKGCVGSEIFSDNTKAWSGDHCVAPETVPGVLLASAPLHAQRPRLVDLAATVLDVFGVPSRSPMQGRSLLRRPSHIDEADLSRGGAPAEPVTKE